MPGQESYGQTNVHSRQVLVGGSGLHETAKKNGVIHALNATIGVEDVLS